MGPVNPLFPTNDDQSDPGYVLPPSQPPIHPGQDPNTAADLIREKVAKIYASEPGVAVEIQESEMAQHRSKHQQFMYELNHSGKDLAQIQTEWHNYYLQLSDTEKHQVWQEFYDSNAQQQNQAKEQGIPSAELLAAHKNRVADKPRALKAIAQGDGRSTRQIKAAIQDKVTSGGKLKPKHHLQSLLFGLGTGFLVILIFLFGFFNEVFIAPFIQPSRQVNNVPLIITSDTIAPSSTPEVIIPKINVEIPVNYNETSTNEATIENDLESGIVHYPTTALPGQNGNAAFFGHSSNNIFNPGKYKFAFVLLHELVPGDTFYLTNNGKIYAYKVFSKTIVDPSQVGVLDPVAGHTATATLITCDPPGTSLHRLVVVGDQISPDPGGNTATTASTPTDTGAVNALPGNGQTLWGRFISTAAGKVVIVLITLVLIMFIFRWMNRSERIEA